MKKALLLLFTFTVYSLQFTVAQQTAPVYPPSGGFRIEGNLQANSPTAGVGDWIPGPAGGGGYVMDTAGVPVDTGTTFHIVDVWNVNDDIIGAGQFNDDPNTWWWTTGSTNNKTELNNVLIHFAKDATDSCNTWVMFAADRLSNNGVSYVDFEFLQNTLTRTGVTSGGFSSAGPNGGRTVNDFLFTVGFIGGGMPTNFYFYKWAQISPGVYDYVPFIPPNGTGFGFINAGGEPVPYTAFGLPTYVYFNQFVEGAVNLDVIRGYITSSGALVFKTLMVKTKVSTSPSANLADMASPKQLNNLTINCFVGIEENELQSGISIYPNPAHNKFVVSSSEFVDRVTIYDVTGREVYTEQLRTTNHELRTALSPGLYFVTVSDGEKAFTQKLVVE